MDNKVLNNKQDILDQYHWAHRPENKDLHSRSLSNALVPNSALAVPTKSKDLKYLKF